MGVKGKFRLFERKEGGITRGLSRHGSGHMRGRAAAGAEESDKGFLGSEDVQELSTLEHEKLRYATRWSRFTALRGEEGKAVSSAVKPR